MWKSALAGAVTALAIAMPQVQAQDQQTLEQDKFMSAQTANEWLTTEIIGRQVQNAAGEEIGKIDYLIVNESNQVVAAVIGVGGFLGIGRKPVAVKLDAISRKRTDAGVELIANLTEEALEAAPAFKRAPKARRRETSEDPAGQMTSLEAEKKRRQATGQSAAGESESEQQVK